MFALSRSASRLFWGAGGVILLLNGALFSWTLLKPGPHALVAAVDNLAQTGGYLLGVLFCVTGLVRTLIRKREGKTSLSTSSFWVPLLLGLAICSMFVGQAIYTVYEQLLHLNFPFPSWADAGYLGAYPFLLLGILLLPSRSLSSSGRSKVLLDGVMIMLSAMTASWYFVLGPTLIQGEGTVFAKVIGAAYPICDLVLVLCILLMLLRSSEPSMRPILWILSAALLLSVLADSLLDYQSLYSTYTTGALFDVCWPLGWMLIGWAGLLLSLRRQESNTRPLRLVQQNSGGQRVSLARALLPYVLLPLILVLVVMISGHRGAGLLELGVYLGGALLLGLVLVRQIVALHETNVFAIRTEGLNQHLEQANTRLEALATTDPLTGLPNHGALHDDLSKEIERSRRYGHPLSLLFFDGDHFKRVNDTSGHSVGDAVLRDLGQRVGSVLRAGDTLGRYGGEEFLVILPETEATLATEVAERIRAAVAQAPLARSLLPEGVPITISIGVASFPEDGETMSELLEHADQAMYWAKRLGRNQVRTAQEALRASQDHALAATIHTLERREGGTLDGLSLEQEVRAQQLSAIHSLLWLLETRDPGISAHAYQVSDLAAAIARQMGCEQEAQLTVTTAALLHDVGKIAIPDALLQKAGALSAREQTLMQQHPALGAQILEVSPYLHHLIPAVASHHENWDGTGYPQQLAGTAIPLLARIIRVAESYESMITDQPYQRQRSATVARMTLEQYAGTRFDPEVVRAALQALENPITAELSQRTS